MGEFAAFVEIVTEMAALANTISDAIDLTKKMGDLYQKLKEIGGAIYDFVPGKRRYTPVVHYNLAAAHTWLITNEAIRIFKTLTLYSISEKHGREVLRSFVAAIPNATTHLHAFKKIDEEESYVSLTVPPFLPAWTKLNKALNMPNNLSPAEATSRNEMFYEAYNTLMALFENAPFTAHDIMTRYDFAWHRA